jgi:hypothetical protein
MAVALAGSALFLFQVNSARAQDTVDALEKDLQQIKQNHQDATTQAYQNFLTQLQTALQSPDAALNLYETSGGSLPAGAPVQSSYAHETPHEKEAREAQDAAALANLAIVAQIHCGLLKFAGQMAMTPDQKGLHEDWIAWLKAAPQIYLQLKDDGLPQTKELRKKPVKDSIICSALQFSSWGDKGQGSWTVNGLPEIYRSEILEPLRATPTPDTLTAWDAYISLRAASQPNQDKWNQIEYPSLQFDRGCDDYAITPTVDKLQVLHDIIKANPTHPRFDDMISKLHALVQDYRTRHGGGSAAQTAAAPSTNAAPVDPNVKVTTVTDGDMTIITTSSNSPSSTPPANPPAPAPTTN